MLTAYEARTIAEHFMIAAIWADCPEGTHPRATRAALQTAEQCAREFVEQIGESLFRATLTAYSDHGLHPDCNGTPLAAFGHDLYLTLAGHGVGFWDREALEENGIGDTLTKHCKAMHGWQDPYGSGNLEFYRGWAHFRAPSDLCKTLQSRWA